MHLRKTLLQARTQIQEILKRQVGMQSADDVKFRHCLGVSGSCSLESLFKRHSIGAGRVFLSPKRAQPARSNANICGIDMPVDVEVSLVAMHALAHQVGHPADGENVAGAVQRQSVVGIEPFAGENSLVNRL